MMKYENEIGWVSNDFNFVPTFKNIFVQLVLILQLINSQKVLVTTQTKLTVAAHMSC